MATERKDIWRLHLFIAGQSPQSERSVKELNAMVAKYCDSDTSITVTDLLNNPEAAVANDILAIPTLIREMPKPPLRVIGDLSDAHRVWTLLSS